MTREDYYNGFKLTLEQIYEWYFIPCNEKTGKNIFKLDDIYSIDNLMYNLDKVATSLTFENFFNTLEEEKQAYLGDIVIQDLSDLFGETVVTWGSECPIDANAFDLKTLSKAQQEAHNMGEKAFHKYYED